MYILCMKAFKVIRHVKMGLKRTWVVSAWVSIVHCLTFSNLTILAANSLSLVADKFPCIVTLCQQSREDVVLRGLIVVTPILN